MLGRLLCLAIALLCAAALHASSPDAIHIDNSAHRDPLVIGVLASEGKDKCMEMWKPTADYLSERITSCAFSITPLGYDEIEAAVRDRNVDFVVCNPAIYIDLDAKFSIRTVATGVRWQGNMETQLLGGVVITKADRDDITTFKDLKGKRIAAVDPKAFGGWIAACREFKKADIVPEKDFRSMRFTENNSDVVRIVREGDADVGVIQTMTLESLATERNERVDDLKVIRDVNFIYGERTFPFRLSTRLYPEWPFAVLAHVSKDLAGKISIALIEMPQESQAAQASRLHWSVPMSYHMVTECIQELQLGIYKGYGKLDLASFFQRYAAQAIPFAAFVVLLVIALAFSLILTIKLRRTGTLLKTELAERTRTEAELKLAKEAAEAADHAKSEFLATMSHEIRTPLNPLLGFAGLLKDTSLSETQRRYVDIIRSSGESLLLLINDILDLAKIEAGKIELERLPFNLRDCVMETAALLESHAQLKNITIKTEFTDNVPLMVAGDRTRLRQILINIAGNAVKFTDKGGVEIRVTTLRTLIAGGAEPSLHEIRIDVKDSGIGIAADRLPKLFKPFSQADQSISRKYGGTGLGLVISRRLCGLMGGSVTVASVLGTGTTFSCVLQLESAPDNEAETGMDAANRDPLIAVTLNLGLNVLIVDDNLANYQFASEVLTKRGCACEHVETGEQAVDLFAQKNYDLILMDVRLPGIDGMEVTRQIRSMETASILPSKGRKRPFIIALTAHAMVGDRQKCLSSGMDAYISKPYNPDLLVGIVRKAFPYRTIVSRPKNS